MRQALDAGRMARPHRRALGGGGHRGPRCRRHATRTWRRSRRPGPRLGPQPSRRSLETRGVRRRDRGPHRGRPGHPAGVEGTAGLDVYPAAAWWSWPGWCRHRSPAGAAAVRIARGTPGVRRVETFFVSSRPSRLSDQELTEEIKAKFVEDSRVEEREVAVGVYAGHVVLVGVVPGLRGGSPSSTTRARWAASCPCGRICRWAERGRRAAPALPDAGSDGMQTISSFFVSSCPLPSRSAT